VSPGPADAAIDPAPDPRDALAGFSPLVREWFIDSFAAPTAAQAGAWRSIAAGQHTLVVAPTGSGKTLAAFLSAIDELVSSPGTGTADDVVRGDARPAGEPAPGGETTRRGRCRVLYISPLKALAVDVERNLRSPLTGIAALAAARGETIPHIDVAVRSGDTHAAQRAAFARRGADILITTPESLFLLLTSQARRALTGIETVIVDEVHAVAGTKRGAHLAVSLDRLDALIGRPAQRIGLSATVRPIEEVARFLAGGRAVTVVAPPADKQVDIEVVIPVPDLSEIDAPAADLEGSATGSRAKPSIWPHVEERIVDLIEAHRSTIVFANSRRLAERLTARLNEIHAARLDAQHSDDAAPLDATIIARDTSPPRPAAASTASTIATHSLGMPAQIMAQSGAGMGAPPVLARAHHGSVSREQRAEIEDALKRGVLPAVVATSSLELGIDMGAVDLVIQVESPPSVASGLQRIGRAGHQVGAPSKGVLFPKFRGDLVSAAVATERMRAGLIEKTHVVTNPLDVAAQQIVSICAMDTVTVDELLALLRRSAPFATLGRGALESVLDMLSGRYPSEQFAELRPRLTWDRATDRLIARPGAQRLAVTSGGTIPDRGLYGVFLAGSPEIAPSLDGADSVDPEALSSPETEMTPSPASRGGARASARTGGRRVGELDEEMVYESRVGDVFVLGSSSWRIVDIGRDRVEVTPAPGIPGRLPFWKADSAGRPAELGAAHGGFVREIASTAGTSARDRLTAIGLDPFAADNLLAYLAEQQRATGVLPDDRTLVVERFRDELGDWLVVLHSPYGAAVHAPWALVLAARMRERYGIDVQAQHSDDGIVLRFPDVEYDGSDWGLPDLADLMVLDPDTVRADVTAQLGGSAVFAARFRECAARSLLFPRHQANRRQPLWQQRQRAVQLLEVAADYPEFPVVAEAARECLADVFDVASLALLMRRIAAREVAVVEVTTPAPSPFARSLLFGYVAQFIYEGDSPLAERRAAALTIDPALLAELLGTAEAPSLRDLLDAGALVEVERSLQRLAPDRRARSEDEITDLVRILGPLTAAEIAARSHLGPGSGAAVSAEVGAATNPEAAFEVVPDVAADVSPEKVAAATMSLARLAAARRVIEVRIAGQAQWADPADAALLRDALGVALPEGIAEAFLEPVSDPLSRLLGRYARTHGPFTAAEPAARFGLGVAVVRDALSRLISAGRLVAGEFRPLGGVLGNALGNALGRDLGSDLGGVLGTGAAEGEIEYVDPAVLRLLRRRSLAALRAEVEPVAPETLGRFLPAWNGIEPAHSADRRGAGGQMDRLFRAVEQLAGTQLPASALETLILPARIPEYSSVMLDDAMAAGDVLWSAHGEIGGGDAWIALHLAETAPLTLPVPPDLPGPPPGPLHTAILDVLRRGGAFFFAELVDAVRAAVPHHEGGEDRQAKATLDGPSTATADHILEALWDLVFAGLVTGDTLKPLRARLSGGHAAHRVRQQPPPSRIRSPSRLATLGRRGIGASYEFAARAAHVPGHAAGRWSLLPRLETDPTVRLHAAAELLLDRYGVVTRGSVVAEETPGGFAGIYRVLAAMEESGRIRRGYFVEGLGAAQFADAGAVDRLRAMAPLPGDDGSPSEKRREAPSLDKRGERSAPGALVLASADPANPYGAALPWPEPITAEPAAAQAVSSEQPGTAPPATSPSTGHRPSRRAGAMVCLVDGAPVMYTERGGRTLLTFTTEPGLLARAAGALADVALSGRIEPLTITRVDGASVHGATSPGAAALHQAGFRSTPRGLRLRPGLGGGGPHSSAVEHPDPGDRPAER
jgi:ATP-dependent Lhr-like helicase